MPLGIGDKLLLRLAAWKLGLCKVATFPNRARQFGSCIANSHESGKLNFFPWKHSMNELKIDIGISVDICETTSHAIIKNGEKEAEWFKEEPKFHDIEIYKTICNQARSSNDILKKCFENNEILNRVESLINILSKSVELRVNKQPNLCRKCTFSKYFHCSHSKIGILFSGRLDSTVLAILANKYVPLHESIDLYNVAFQNPAKKIMNFNVPDRKTGEIAFEELKKLSPLRKWNFIKVDVTHDELVTWRQNLIAHLIHPLNTVLDDSLGCTLWFASRGQGVLSTGQPYSSYARVILLGLGADEMLGGYMRHRTQRRRERSWMTLANDLDIIGRRNLGRDNRVLANHGCQPRLPYLDEHVVAFIQSLPPWHRCCLSDEMPLGIGDKLLLRLAAWKLGLCKVATFPKRARQFGSCIANSHESGSSVSHRL
ncbi:asparagine synthetase domain-containing protein 1-like isoform X2 [Lycorma delicatula]